MTALLQQTLEELASTEKQQKRLVAYLREHEAEILNYVNNEVDTPPPKTPDPKETENDPWATLDIDSIAVETGIPDLAKNYKHYLYGLPKRP